MAKQIIPIQLYTAAVQDSAANIDVPADGDIVGYFLQVFATALDAAGDGAKGELSFGSTNQFTTNDARNVICSLEFACADIQTAETPLVQAISQLNFGGDGMPVAAGERIHMHTAVTGGAAFTRARAILYFRFSSQLRLRRR